MAKSKSMKGIEREQREEDEKLEKI